MRGGDTGIQGKAGDGRTETAKRCTLAEISKKDARLRAGIQAPGPTGEEPKSGAKGQPVLPGPVRADEVLRSRQAPTPVHGEGDVSAEAGVQALSRSHHGGGRGHRVHRAHRDESDTHGNPPRRLPLRRNRAQRNHYRQDGQPEPRTMAATAAAGARAPAQAARCNGHAHG